MANEYRVVDTAGKQADQIQAELNQAEVDGFVELRGTSNSFVLLHQTKQKVAAKRK